MEFISATLILTVFGAGLISFFSPCVLPLMPVYLGYLSGGSDLSRPSGRASLFKALAFTAGLSVSFFILGFGAGALGHLINSRVFFIVCGLVVIIFGLHQTGLISLPALTRDKRLSVNFSPEKGLIGAFALGFFFSFGWTPCVGPVLGAVLGLTSQQGGALTGGWLLLVYSLGLSLPFVAVALGSGYFMAKLKKVYPHFKKIRILGGVLIILMGGWMIYSQWAAPAPASPAQSTTVSTVGRLSESAYKRTLTDIDGRTLSLAEFRGKNVYVKFWGTWCPMCLAGLDDFKALSEQAKDSSDLAVISIVNPGINGEMNKDDFVAWAKAQELGFPIYFDESGLLNRELGLRAYPAAIYLDHNGVIAKKSIGDEPNERIIETITSIFSTAEDRS
ncbi:redoxin family protein [Deltaproteobacteria bacterium OttesenSCG-928-M10]|nr:redoxin family protein [Deltaproteobacteria bacterium OttesenSCG-928-M10]MDL2259437.1 redoxin family protein [Deltaproteobacteria bacterium OttesenSCG-928-K17]